MAAHVQLWGASRDDDALLDVVATVAAEAAAFPDRVGAALEVAAQVAAALPRPSHGETATLWSALATIGAIDLGVARAIEPHLDAVTILADARDAGLDVRALDAGGSLARGSGAGGSGAGGQRDAPTWGVFAAEGAGHRLTATRVGDAWTLDGSKPWCSLAGRLDRALVTAVVGDARGLFAIDLRHPGVAVDDAAAWASHGLPDVPSVPIRLDGVPAEPVGDPGWYLSRPGFAWGGIGVAAIWLGGAIGVARSVHAAAARREPDQIALVHLGELDLAIVAARATLAAIAAEVDALAAGDRAADARDHRAPASPEMLALRARSAAVDAVDRVLAIADRALGPAPLALEADHARRVSDLRIYVRQHHAERDVAALGRAVAAGRDAPW